MLYYFLNVYSLKNQIMLKRKSKGRSLRKRIDDDDEQEDNVDMLYVFLFIIMINNWSCLMELFLIFLEVNLKR